MKSKIKFYPGPHQYINLETRHTYISVTTLISKYVPIFDSNYWATYKAIKDVLGSYSSSWRIFKQSAGGWEGVVDYYKEFGAPNNKNSEVEKRIKWYLDKWTSEKDIACSLGTRFHKEMEDIVKGIREVERNSIPMLVSEGDVDLMKDSDDAIFPELLIYNHKYKLAGQADVVEKIIKDVWISDYKTCKEISNEPFREEKLLPPLDELYNTNYNHYLMQMSTYGWMLEQFGYNVKELRLIHAHRNTGKHIKDYIMPYRPDLVELMLKDYIS